MREAGRILADCHRTLESRILPGITTLEIDAWVEQFLNKRGATPEQKGYKGFPYATCASVNEVVCHGFPSERVLHDGDIVTIDIVVNKDGWLADRGWTYAVGNISRPVARLLRQTHKALMGGIEVARPGRTLGDIGHAVEKAAGWRRFGNVKPLIGHGIGRQMHEPPEVLHYGRPKTGLPLREGMVITIEPVFTLGTEGPCSGGRWLDHQHSRRQLGSPIRAHDCDYKERPLYFDLVKASCAIGSQCAGPLHKAL